MAEAKESGASKATAAKSTGRKTVTGNEYDGVVKSYYEGKMKPGYGIRFVTSGGATKPVVTKLA